MKNKADEIKAEVRNALERSNSSTTASDSRSVEQVSKQKKTAFNLFDA